MDVAFKDGDRIVAIDKKNPHPGDVDRVLEFDGEFAARSQNDRPGGDGVADEFDGLIGVSWIRGNDEGETQGD
jgi:hypothetical protein